MLRWVEDRSTWLSMLLNPSKRTNHITITRCSFRAYDRCREVVHAKIHSNTHHDSSHVFGNHCHMLLRQDSSSCLVYKPFKCRIIHSFIHQVFTLRSLDRELPAVFLLPEVHDMEPETKLKTFYVLFALIVVMLLRFTVGAQADPEEQQGAENAENPWPHPWTSPSEQPLHSSPSSASASTSRVLESQELTTPGPHMPPFRTWPDEPLPEPAIEVQPPEAARSRLANLSASLECDPLDFSNVDLVTLLTSCSSSLADEEITTDCCTELVKIEKDITTCFCSVISTLLGTSLEDLAIPTLITGCTDLTYPCA
ncbi:hypothetical protein Mapa_015873 [Marchantia paleacea]|nr:hypothetical protein Mapa_015873 [Marchantia paleacea]